ncbi:DUF5710 domain-containing protein, partial [Campylobacter fetus]|uniref:DUF5710 domain-containing protein n=1 Tax=Campylobacter fetus TaxID=196 RepID=UPI001F2C5A25
MGLDYDPNQHLSYISSWVQILKDKPTEIFKATSDATKIVNFVDELNLGKKQVIIQENITEQANSEVLNLATKKTFLYVPFSQKDEAKSAGAKWDKESKMWYAPKGSDLNKLSKWQTSQIHEENSNSNAIDEFKVALNNAGLNIDGEPIMDGKLHRVSVDGDRGNEKSGAYIGYLNGHPAGYIQNYKAGIKENWKSSVINHNISKTQEIDLKNTIEANKIIKEQREAKLLQSYENTAIKLQNEYDNAKWANKEHPYL